MPERTVESTRAGVEAAIQGIQATQRTCDKFRRSATTTSHTQPLAILLGNHSAGKSSLVNALLGIKEQITGVAPTDDGFTVLRRGHHDMEEDGPTAVSSPSYGFDALRSFGPSFVNRFKVKTRKLPAHAALPPGMMIVDTPGMIDTPAAQGQQALDGGQRGYDFLAVTKWFAERADVILLMFDPANPGTTGETLDVMQKSLRGQEHKFLILLNKVDMFSKVTDFARCYGTLCWNLSKNIGEKDIPRIYTTYTASSDVTVNTRSAAPLEELDAVRAEVFGELLHAPLKRVDNLVTESEEAARRAHMMGTIANWCISRRRAFRVPRIAAAALSVSTPVLLGVGALQAGVNPKWYADRLITLVDFVRRKASGSSGEATSTSAPTPAAAPAAPEQGGWFSRSAPAPAAATPAEAAKAAPAEDAHKTFLENLHGAVPSSRLEWAFAAIYAALSAAHIVSTLRTVGQQLREYDGEMEALLDEAFLACYIGSARTAEVEQRWRTHVRPSLVAWLCERAPAFPGTGTDNLRQLTRVVDIDVPAARGLVVQFKEAYAAAQDRAARGLEESDGPNFEQSMDAAMGKK